MMANLDLQGMTWHIVLPLMDKIDDVFRKVLTSKEDEIDVRLMIGMDDALYTSRMADYFANVKELLQDVSDRTSERVDAKQKLVVDAFISKLEYLSLSSPRWPMLTRSAVIALADSLARMPEGIKEVSLRLTTINIYVQTEDDISLIFSTSRHLDTSKWRAVSRWSFPRAAIWTYPNGGQYIVDHFHEPPFGHVQMADDIWLVLSRAAIWTRPNGGRFVVDLFNEPPFGHVQIAADMSWVF